MRERSGSADDLSPFSILPDTTEIREAGDYIFNRRGLTADSETPERLAYYWAILREAIYRDIERRQANQPPHPPSTEQAEGDRQP